MTTVSLAPPPILQFFNNAGQPAAGGSVLTQVGGVNHATYSDSAGTIPLPNPIPLNSRGEISTALGISSQLFLESGVVYTFTLYDSNGVQLNQATYTTAPAATSSQLTFVQAGAGAITRTVQNKERDIWSALDYATGDGTTDDKAQLVALNTAAAGKTIHFPAGVYRVASNMTFSGCALQFDEGAIIKPDAGVTVTIQCPITAATYQIFNTSNAGAVISISNSYQQEVYPEWWGATPTDATGATNTPAVQAAFNTGLTVVFTQAFTVNAAITHQGNRVRGLRAWRTNCGLNWKITAAGTNFTGLAPAADGLSIDADHVSFSIDAGSTITGGTGAITLLDTIGSRFNKIKDCIFNGQNVAITGAARYTAIHFIGHGAVAPYDQWVSGCIFNSCDYDIHAEGTAAQQVIGLNVRECNHSAPRNTFANIRLTHTVASFLLNTQFNAGGVSGGVGAYDVWIDGNTSGNIEVKSNYHDGGVNGKQRIRIDATAGGAGGASGIVIDSPMISSTEILNSSGSQIEVFDHAWKTWTPTWVGMTEVVTGGAIVYAGRYKRDGSMYDWEITITPPAGSTTASTAGSTYCNNMPFSCSRFAAFSVASQNMTSVVSNGVQRTDIPAGALMPTWAATGTEIVASGRTEVL